MESKIAMRSKPLFTYDEKYRKVEEKLTQMIKRIL
jgi:hypothetical protein